LKIKEKEYNMVAPHEHTTSEVKANIKRISRNSGAGDNMGPQSIGGGSSGNMTTCTEGVEPKGDQGDVVNKRGI
jgi:hypothetical protein